MPIVIIICNRISIQCACARPNAFERNLQRPCRATTFCLARTSMLNIVQEVMSVASPTMYVASNKQADWLCRACRLLQRARAPFRVRNAVTGILVGDVRSQRLGVLYPRRQTGYLRRCRRGSKGNALCANAAAGGRDCVQRCCCCCSSHCERQPNARHHIYRRPSFWPCSRPSSRSSGWRFGTRAGGDGTPDFSILIAKHSVWGAPPVDRIGRLSDRKHYGFTN